jgi:hypothetical protein
VTAGGETPTPVKHKIRPSNLYLVLVIFVMISIAVGGNAWYTQRVDSKRASAEREADRRWCVLFDLITANDNPQQTPEQRQFMQVILSLRASFGCRVP